MGPTEPARFDAANDRWHKLLTPKQDETVLVNF